MGCSDDRPYETLPGLMGCLLEEDRARLIRGDCPAWWTRYVDCWTLYSRGTWGIA